MLYTGFLGFPWPVFILGIALLAFQVAGLRLALFAAAGFLLILVNGLWGALVQSLYLCTLAVLLCLLIGGALGVWAAYSERSRASCRPICDALQTMPQFVFLIPALMFFKVGEFTALIAIMLYAIVPPIRYVEHGLRHVRADVVEAVEQMGATPAQTLFQAKLPLALPVVMLGSQPDHHGGAVHACHRRPGRHTRSRTGGLCRARQGRCWYGPDRRPIDRLSGDFGRPLGAGLGSRSNL